MNVVDIFPTKIILDTNIELAAELLPICEKYTNMTETNLLGINNFPSTLQNKPLSDLVDKEPIVEKAFIYLKNLISQYEKNYFPGWKINSVTECAFFSSMQKYSFLKKHRHLQCNYSGIIYLEIGKDVPPLRIFDSNPYTTDVMDIIPYNGAVVIFPCFLEHSLDQKMNDEPRKVFTFNL